MPTSKFEANFQTTDRTVKEIERAATSHLNSINSLEQQEANLQLEVARLNQKCEDLEGRSRRQNLRIIGIPEGYEGSKPRDFITDMLRDVFNLDKVPLIDCAHRISQQRPRPSDPPRPFILSLHYYHAYDDILRRASAAKDLQYQGKKIRIFPDYSPSVAKRRALFNRARGLLCDGPGVRYGLLYPARLIVTYDSVQTSFTGPAKAEEYAERL